jgi:8-oxo-dGTP pyrophosphatase MutT (NUDIX family)
MHYTIASSKAGRILTSGKAIAPATVFARSQEPSTAQAETAIEKDKSGLPHWELWKPSMSAFDLLKEVVDTIAADEPAVWGEPRHASVGILIAGAEQNPSICFIRRAKWQSDPWSEHIAFPGGSRSANEDAWHTLRRELQEEIGWLIEADQRPVQLPQLRIRLAGRERLLLLDAFVYQLEGTPPALQCGPEVASAFWIPVAELWSAKNLDYHTLGDCGETLVYPAIRTSHGIIFGITLRVLTLLSDHVGIPLRYLEEIPMLRRTSTR